MPLSPIQRTNLVEKLMKISEESSGGTLRLSHAYDVLLPEVHSDHYIALALSLSLSLSFSLLHSPSLSPWFQTGEVSKATSM